MATGLQKRGGNDVWPFPGFGRFFDDVLTSWPANQSRALRPAMDVEENEDALTIRTELAGVKKDDVQITLEDGVLTITGEKHSDRETKDKNYHLVERSFGSFHRSLQLPSGVQSDKAEASFEDGVLVITVPKTEQAKPRKLQIK